MGLIKTAAKVAVASSVHGRIQRRQQLRWAQQDQQQAGGAIPAQGYGAPASHEYPAQPGTSAAGPDYMNDRLGQLAKLGELKNAGVLTDAEFEEQKARILNQLSAASAQFEGARGSATWPSRWYLLLMDVSSAAAQVRSLLREAGFLEWEPGRRGFAVEGDPQGGWVVVSCVSGVGFLPGAALRRKRDLRQYRDILAAAGYHVTDSPWIAAELRVTDALEV